MSAPAPGTTTGRAMPLALAGALPLLICLVLPASLYFGNLSELSSLPGQLAPFLMIPALVLALLAVATIGLAGQRNRTLACAVLAAIVLLAWVQSYLLVWDYDIRSGSKIDWQVGAWRGWLDGAMWIGGIAAAAALHARLHRPLAIGALAVVAMQVLAVGAGAFTHREALGQKVAHAVEDTDPAPLAHFSAQRNVVHIVLDSFQADVFKDLISGPDGASIQAALPGFTFFEEHLASFPATYLALPVIVSGQIYRNQVPQREFMESAYSQGSVLHAARKAGYEVDIAADSWMLELLSLGGVDHAYSPGKKPASQEAARLLDLALFRSAPHWLKPRVYRDQRWLMQPLVARSELVRFAYFTHNAFLAGVVRNFAVDRPAPVYKYFHLLTTHAPMVVNPDCSYAGGGLTRARETVTAQSRCSLAFVGALLARMKAAGIYDDSLIVLMADHGGHVPPHRYEPSTLVEGGVEYALRPDLVGLATPLLLIKPPGAKGPFRISQELTSAADLAATLDDLLGLHAGLPGTSIWRAPPGHGAERHFYGYIWSRLDPGSRYITSIHEYTLTGSAYDIRSWHLGPEFLPPAQQGSASTPR